MKRSNPPTTDSKKSKKSTPLKIKTNLKDGQIRSLALREGILLSKKSTPKFSLLFPSTSVPTIRLVCGTPKIDSSVFNTLLVSKLRALKTVISEHHIVPKKFSAPMVREVSRMIDLSLKLELDSRRAKATSQAQQKKKPVVKAKTQKVKAETTTSIHQEGRSISFVPATEPEHQPQKPMSQTTPFLPDSLPPTDDPEAISLTESQTLSVYCQQFLKLHDEFVRRDSYRRGDLICFGSDERRLRYLLCNSRLRAAFSFEYKGLHLHPEFALSKQFTDINQCFLNYDLTAISSWAEAFYPSTRAVATLFSVYYERPVTPPPQNIPVLCQLPHLRDWSRDCCDCHQSFNSDTCADYCMNCRC